MAAFVQTAALGRRGASVEGCRGADMIKWLVLASWAITAPWAYPAEMPVGDTIGWMNRGLYWSDVQETENSWSVRLRMEGDFLPPEATVGVTPRGLPCFQPRPNETLLGNGHPAQADESGLITAPAIRLERGVAFDLQVARIE